jgi:hypothetical protein
MSRREMPAERAHAVRESILVDIGKVGLALSQGELSPEERQWAKKRLAELKAVWNGVEGVPAGAPPPPRDVDPRPADSPPAPTLKWHVYPVCGLAGWARERRSYCRTHGEQPPEESPFGVRPLTAIEVVLGRTVLREPPSLRAWVKRFGGYANITAEGWVEYDAAMEKFRSEKPEEPFAALNYKIEDEQ